MAFFPEKLENDAARAMKWRIGFTPWSDSLYTTTKSCMRNYINPQMESQTKSK